MQQLSYTVLDTVMWAVESYCAGNAPVEQSKDATGVVIASKVVQCAKLSLVVDMARESYADKSVLIVDDNDVLLRKVKAIIRTYGIRDIRTASNGIDAIRQCKEKPPDLVLLDIIMPVVSGWEVLRELKHNDSKAKVIVFSIRDNAEAGLEAARLGATDFIPKGDIFDPSAEIKIKRALDRGTPVSENTTTTLIRNYVDELSHALEMLKKNEGAVADRLDELAKATQDEHIDKKRTIGALRVLEEALAHATGYGIGHSAIRGIEKLLDLL